MADKPGTTIIIKKIKKYSAGHHGGAWKVAYADFVTAMMAFFLLMWLLSSSSKDVLKGIADYFTPTMGVARSVGIGFEGGQTPDSQGSDTGKTKTIPSVVYGMPIHGNTSSSPEPEDSNSKEDFANLAQALKNGINNDKILAKYSDHFIIDQTNEGLRMQIVDHKNRPIFLPGTSILADYSEEILQHLSQLLKFMPHYLAIYGYTNGSDNNFDHWGISTQRSTVARSFMQKSGIDPEQFSKVGGKANKHLLIPENPDAPENIRLSIILLNRQSSK